MQIQDIKTRIRDIPDFPKPGIVFKDITPLLADGAALRRTAELLSERLEANQVEAMVAIESRGFLVGAALSMLNGMPLHLVRKPGKLPYETRGVDYDLEYGSDRVEIHVDSIESGRRYGIVDDLIATGGTASATASLIELQGGVVGCCAFIIELSFLAGRARLSNHPVESLIVY